MKYRMPVAVLVATLCSPLGGCDRDGASAGQADADWPAYGGHETGDRYSGLTQITPANVTSLKVAWRVDHAGTGESQTQPLVVGGTVYTYTPDHKVLALDAATGERRWQFDSGLVGTGPARGLTWWTDGKTSRVFASVMNYLFALDPATGTPLQDFGVQGAVDLRQGLRGDPHDHFVALTSPGIVYKDLLIVGFRTSETMPAPPGDIRAYDVRTGELRWTFHTLPEANEPGAGSWPGDARATSGAANNWVGMVIDAGRGIVYVPTGSAVPDFIGIDRKGDNLYANSLLALDAATGKRLWHFQLVHHDIWDRDPPSPPVLLTIRRNGKQIDAVAQTTKQGFVFVFDRVSGEPLFPVEERAYPASSLPGEVASPTQPFPVLPEPIARQRLTEDMLTTRTPEAHAAALDRFRTMRSDGQFVPLALGKPTVVFPGFDGGAEWGGAAVDPRSGVLYVNANDVAWTGELAPNVPVTGVAASLYQVQCAACHGVERKGSPPAFPSLVDVGRRLPAADVVTVIRDGRGRMPPFGALGAESIALLQDYLVTGNDRPLPSPVASAGPVTAAQAGREPMTRTLRNPSSPGKYRFTGYQKFLDADGYPAIVPPWGTLNAIDLNTGKYLWKVPLGEYPELVAQGMKDTGSENYGGPVVTEGGLVFIGATVFDHKLRAFDSRTGKVLWQYELPYAGTATPAVYSVAGKQYVVISTSNARNRNAPQGSALIAFSLP
ncbi:MAG: PQQ-binding-like beta-propeller repeat protein [Steroidobacteraceae bacterium]